jgi:hypothetical protein
VLKPLVLTPTPESRDRFMREVWAARLTWGSAGTTEDRIRIASERANYIAAFLSDEKTVYYFVESKEEMNLRLNRQRTHVLVNSPRQFVWATKRQS